MLPDFLKKRKTYFLITISLGILVILGISYGYFTRDSLIGDSSNNTIDVSTIESGSISRSFSTFFENGSNKLKTGILTLEDGDYEAISKFKVENIYSDDFAITINWDYVSSTLDQRYTDFQLYECNETNYNNATLSNVVSSCTLISPTANNRLPNTDEAFKLQSADEIVLSANETKYFVATVHIDVRHYDIPKYMTCYNCTTTNDVETKTNAATTHNTTAIANTPKEDHGYARITNITTGTVTNYNYNGTTGANGSYQMFPAPNDGIYKLEVWGAQGGSYGTTAIGGYGGYSVGSKYLLANEKLYIFVGGKGLANETTSNVGGYNGGGYSGSNTGQYSAGGGGATDIRYYETVPSAASLVWNDSVGLTKRIIVAGGGAGNVNILTTLAGSGGGFKGNAMTSSSSYNTSTYLFPGATQDFAGNSYQSTRSGGFGYARQSNTGGYGGGGGGGYYGGGNGYGTTGAGGSGYIGGVLPQNVNIGKSFRAIIDVKDRLTRQLTLDLNGGQISSTTTVDLKTGDELALPIPTKTGYTFSHWTITEGLDSTVVDSLFTMGSTDTTIRAEWTTNTYTITYNINGGNGGTTAKSTHTYGTAKTLTPNGFWNIVATTTGVPGMVYYFKGWDTVSGGTTVRYTDKQSVNNLTTTNGSNINLYAVWGALFNYSASYKVHNDGSGNWRVKLLTSGTYTSYSTPTVDLFVVGGGGGSGGYYGSGGGGGGGGGYTNTYRNIKLIVNTNYTVSIGAGGAVASDGNISYFGASNTYYANGGKAGGNGGPGGDGGSGGGRGANKSICGVGGSDGKKGGYNAVLNLPGIGQGTTTREFGENNGALYGGGGGGGTYTSGSAGAGGSGGGGAGGFGTTGTPGAVNTGGGAGGSGSGNGTTGGSGIVIIRNYNNARNKLVINNTIVGYYYGIYSLIDDQNGNWRLRALDNGIFVPNQTAKIDIFVVGGGGGGGTYYASSGGGGGGGGYANTYFGVSVTKGTQYPVIIGEGGGSLTAGGISYFNSLTSYFANGGEAGKAGGDGGAGGSGGGHGANKSTAGAGGSYGNTGLANNNGNLGGLGQQVTTCEFKLGTLTGCNVGVSAYSGGGGGGTYTSGSVGAGGLGGGGAGGFGTKGEEGIENTGGGGGAGGSIGAYGGSGIVIIRNQR